MERMDRFTELVRQEAVAPAPGLYWLSFVDPEIAAGIPLERQVPGGPSFLGVCIIYTAGPMMAVTLSHMHGINPGGEVRMYGPYPVDTWPQDLWNRLLSAADIALLED